MPDPNAVTQPVPVVPQRRIDDPFVQALSEAPWEVRLAYYAARDLWNWLMGAFALIGSALPLISEYIDMHPDEVQFMSSSTRHYLAFVLMGAIFVFNILSIVRKGKQ